MSKKMLNDDKDIQDYFEELKQNIFVVEKYTELYRNNIIDSSNFDFEKINKLFEALKK